VIAFTPGGPADKAGVKPGDTVDSIDGHWVVNGDLIQKFRAAEKQFLAKKLDAGQLNAIRKDIHAKSERALLPLRAWDRLSEGDSGPVQVMWQRSGTTRATTLTKAVSQMPVFSAVGGRIVLPFTADSHTKFEKAIENKSEVTIDLRNNVLGDEAAMRACLALIAPKGEYGRIFSVHSPRGNSLAVKTGNSHPPKINLMVDRTTRGAAEIFALALSSRHLAKLEGADTGGDRSVDQVVELPDGSGYTLKTGTYRPFSTETVGIAKKGGA
jgi:C-terminal processing protease CtpA/Prc